MFILKMCVIKNFLCFVIILKIIFWKVINIYIFENKLINVIMEYDCLFEYEKVLFCFIIC